MENLNEQLETLNINIGNRILKTRLMLGITRDELSKVIGTSQQQLAKYEKGINRVSASRLLLIAKKLSVNINYFYTDKSKAEKNLLIDNSISYSHLNLINKISKLKNKEKSKALSLVLDGLLKEVC